MSEKQRIYVHDVMDDGNKKIVFLNTRGETPEGVREEIQERVSQKISISELTDKVDKNIGVVYFDKNNEVDVVELDGWVLN